jgi:hypothetical protein
MSTDTVTGVRRDSMSIFAKSASITIERSTFSAYFANASLFTTYGILVGSPP